MSKRHTINKLEALFHSIKTQEVKLRKLMDTILDAYNDKKIKRKEMRTLMTKNSALWAEIKAEIVRTEKSLEHKKHESLHD